jgi:Ser/Thr protein kinase RdoA (MazF antagonist)
VEQAEVVGYLLERGLLGAASVVDGKVVVRDASSRNRNFIVERRDGPGVVLKQGIGPLAVATVAHEARVYASLTARANGLSSWLAPFHGYDEQRGVLALGLVADGHDLRTHHLQTGRFPAQLAGSLGRALGALHRLTALAQPVAAPELAPWVLSLHRPDLSVFRDTSAAGIELIKIVQRAAGFAEQLDALRDGWLLASLVHHDVKWDNCIVFARGTPARVRGLKLIDWESAANGDPSWDIGSALSHYLSFWLFSIPVTGTTPPARFPQLAEHPLEHMQPAMRACWNAYAARLGLTGADAEQRLETTVRYAASRLVQTAFEAAQMSDQLTSGLVLHLQLALNMLQRPREAAVHLLGLPAGAGAA